MARDFSVRLGSQELDSNSISIIERHASVGLAYAEQVSILRSLSTAHAGVSPEEWLALKSRLHPKIEPLLATHEADLRENLFGQPYGRAHNRETQTMGPAR